MLIQILHQGYGNSKSLAYAIQRIRNDVEIEVLCGEYLPENTRRPHIFFLPGVGNFGLAMSRIYERNWDSYINKLVSDDVKIVGICLGMQLLAKRSDESPEVEGLGLIEGTVEKLNTLNSRVPHVGWKRVEFPKDRLNEWGEHASRKFYFTHSYHFACATSSSILATSWHGQSEFVAAVAQDNLLGFQFHLEKSGEDGLALLEQVLERS